MSEFKLVSPLLDGFIMGEPMSNHNGVACCPAMKENTREKYIVKIISIPASQRQLDALLLTGAYHDAASATEYFRELSEGVIHEAELLQHLSKLDGYVSYESWQMVPMENGRLGYQIYLLSPYKRSLEKHLRRSTMTHLGAVNLGLDLCEALSVCRRAGHLYIDLRPSNIFLNGQKDFRIGDLGFVRLDGLKYASLPTKYRSCFTPPEMHDALATINTTADVYAVGLVLYQIFNNGVLPFEGHAPAEALPAPLNADYEMAEIILKACAPDPKDRWTEPSEMGQALVAYMQRNVINDTPLVPPVVESSAAQAEEAVNEEALPVTDETLPELEVTEDVDTSEMSDDVQVMLNQADAILSEETAEKAAEDTEEPESADSPEKPQDLASIIHSSPVFQDEDEDYDDYDDDDEEDEEPEQDAASSQRKKKGHSWIAVLITIIILGLLCGGGYYFYKNYYLKTIDRMNITGFENTLTVELTTQVEDELLTVVCTDTYGNTKFQSVVDGVATFTDLTPDTNYKVTVEIDGFHYLAGSTFGNYTTAEQTNIISFTAVTGTEDGSVILNFTVDGPESQDFLIEYSTEGEEVKTQSVTGHMATISGLTVGKTYTFTLKPAPDTQLYLVGNNTLQFQASKIIVAENLAIVSCVDGVLTAKWNAPADSYVAGWTVRCYASEGFDETITVTEPTAQFTGIASDKAYTVEVTATDMTQSARAFVTANPVTIQNIQVDSSDPRSLKVTWDHTGATPDGGWLLMYNFAGSEDQDVEKCTENSGVIPVHIPNTTYEFVIQAADGATVFEGKLEYTTPKAAQFDAYALFASAIEARLCNTPAKENWTYKDLKDSDYTSIFPSEKKASFVLHATKKFYLPKEDVLLTFIIRDKDGNVVADLINEYTLVWQKMWKNYYASIDIPAMPTLDGSYTIELYFNNCFVTSQSFSITGSG